MEIVSGLRPKTKDERDHRVGQLFNLPKVSELPAEFVVGLPLLKNQGFNTYTCALASSGALAELHENVELAWKWPFAVAKSIEGGDLDHEGIELRTACKVICKYGIPELADLPPGFQDKPQEFLNRIENWPDLYEKALKHKQGSFFDVSASNGMDAFDTLRATIYALRGETDGILLGVYWAWGLSQIIMEVVPQGGSGHAIAGLGWKMQGNKPYLYIQNSYGPTAGENGRHYFSREVINANISNFGAFGFHPMSKESAQELIRKNQLSQLSYLKRICILLKQWVTEVMR